VLPDGELDAAVDELGARLAAGPTGAYAGIKEQLNAWQFARMEAQLELEASLQQRSAASGDFREGVQAFLEKRGAAFEGR
jgi:2-(1,2-epoxy-1,2-dihydrophenyl)acetyl-CoA isomerase